MKKNQKAACLEDLQNQILSLDLSPGTDLDETELSARYEISRTPLREVLQRLAGDGYVAISMNRGAKVASMDFSTMRTFFQTAPLVYSSIARLAAENHTSQQLADLKAVQLRFSSAVEGGVSGEMAMANHRFHELIGDMAHNEYLMRALKRLLIDHTRLGQMFYRPSAPVENDAVLKANQQHDAMIAALEARDIGVITELTLQHWDLSRGRIERFVRPDPLPLDIIDFAEKKNAL